MQRYIFEYLMELNRSINRTVKISMRFDVFMTNQFWIFMIGKPL